MALNPHWVRSFFRFAVISRLERSPHRLERRWDQRFDEVRPWLLQRLAELVGQLLRGRRSARRYPHPACHGYEVNARIGQLGQLKCLGASARGAPALELQPQNRVRTVA